MRASPVEDMKAASERCIAYILIKGTFWLRGGWGLVQGKGEAGVVTHESNCPAGKGVWLGTDVGKLEFDNKIIWLLREYLKIAVDHWILSIALSRFTLTSESGEEKRETLP